MLSESGHPDSGEVRPAEPPLPAPEVEPTPPFTFKRALGVSPVQSALMGLNMAIVLLVCLGAAWVIHQRTASPITAMTDKEVQALKTATVFAGENHELIQQVVVLSSQQAAQLQQLIPALRAAVDAMNGVKDSVDAVNVRIRIEAERITPPKTGKK